MYKKKYLPKKMKLHRFLNEFINQTFGYYGFNLNNECFNEFYYDNDSVFWLELNYHYNGPYSLNIEKVEELKKFVLEHLEDDVRIIGRPEGYHEYTVCAQILDYEFFFTTETKISFNEK